MAKDSSKNAPTWPQSQRLAKDVLSLRVRCGPLDARTQPLCVSCKRLRLRRCPAKYVFSLRVHRMSPRWLMRLLLLSLLLQLLHILLARRSRQHKNSGDCTPLEKLCGAADLLSRRTSMSVVGHHLCLYTHTNVRQPFSVCGTELRMSHPTQPSRQQHPFHKT